MKRCDNCGWINPDHFEKCEKCGNRLGEPAEQNNSEEPEHVAHARVSKYSATMLDTSKVADTLAEDVHAACPKCGYPFTGRPDTCPNCGAKLRHTTLKEGGTETANAHASAFLATVSDVPSAHVNAAGPVTPAPQQSDKAFKSTIRDFFGKPSGRIVSREPAQAPVRTEVTRSENQGQVYRLVPVADSSYPVIYLSEGDIVTIGDRRYKFEK